MNKKKLLRSLISAEESPQFEQQALDEQWKKKVVVWGKKSGDHGTLYCSRVIPGTTNNADPLMVSGTHTIPISLGILMGVVRVQCPWGSLKDPQGNSKLSLWESLSSSKPRIWWRSYRLQKLQKDSDMFDLARFLSHSYQKTVGFWYVRYICLVDYPIISNKFYTHNPSCNHRNNPNLCRFRLDLFTKLQRYICLPTWPGGWLHRHETKS